jgi:hypothetical protein
MGCSVGAAHFLVVGVGFPTWTCCWVRSELAAGRRSWCGVPALSGQGCTSLALPRIRSRLPRVDLRHLYSWGFCRLFCRCLRGFLVVSWLFLTDAVDVLDESRDATAE